MDDMFVAATSEDLLQELERAIKSQYKITVKHDMETYLGVKFENLPGGDIKLTQPKLLKSLFKEYEEELKSHRVHEPITPQRMPARRSLSIKNLWIRRLIFIWKEL